jgi:hypothetical protein
MVVIIPDIYILIHLQIITCDFVDEFISVAYSYI